MSVHLSLRLLAALLGGLLALSAHADILHMKNTTTPSGPAPVMKNAFGAYDPNLFIADSPNSFIAQ